MARWSLALAATICLAAGVALARNVRARRRRRVKAPPAFASSITDLIGNTPLVNIQCLSEATGCLILGKCEYLNPGGSPKDRVALAIVEDAERQGKIAPHRGVTLFEGTVGSTGISLALVARAKGYRCHIVMPDDQAAEKYVQLECLGATVERVRPVSIVDPMHHVRVAQRRALEATAAGRAAGVDDIDMGFFCDQFENPANVSAHAERTGREIVAQTGGRIDALVAGAGTGGTLAGTAQTVKTACPNALVVLADPQGSGLYNRAVHSVLFSETEREGRRRRHQVDTIVEGVGSNRLTANIERALALVDCAERVSDRDAVLMSRLVARHDGIFCGSSTAVALVAAFRTARRLGPGHVIVTFLCDPGTRHFSKFWSDTFLDDCGIEVPAGLLDRAAGDVLHELLLSDNVAS